MSTNSITPIEDDARDVRWWQYVNEYGTLMTKVVCRSTGWSVDSNQYALGGVGERELDVLVDDLRTFMKGGLEPFRMEIANNPNQ